ncbi:MAG: hypothetical protein NTX87_07355 [Planctomycetota bacterium]|nr:hypothetical protein [Planctomycetota bacterium]
MPQARFNLTFSVKRWFFDRDVVKGITDRTTREALAKAGATVRMIARRSMRYVTSLAGQQRQVVAGQRKRLAGEHRSSPPGSPPNAIRPHPFIREFLYYALDPGRGSVVIGPVRINTHVNVPALHEYGGTQVLKAPQRRLRKLGSSGEIRIGGRVGLTTRAILNRHGWVNHVTYAKLRTSQQVTRANRLNEELFGPAGGATVYVASYPPRPFMGPALAVAAPSLPKFWATSVRAA